jgi:hypothetical protein
MSSSNPDKIFRYFQSKRSSMLLSFGLMGIVTIMAYLLFNNQTVQASKFHEVMSSKSVNGITIELRSVSRNADQIDVLLCYPFPTQKSGGYMPRDIGLNMNGESLTYLGSSLSEFQFETGNKITLEDLKRLITPEEWNANGRVIGRCDTLMFKAPNISSPTNAMLNIGGIANDLPESFNCGDLRRALDERRINVTLNCTPPGNGLGFRYSIRNREGIDASQLEKQIVEAVTDYRPGPWAFDISLQ